MPMLRFVFVRSRSSWDPSPGCAPPSGSECIYEVRSIPGGLVGCGRNLDEAEKNLDSLLRWTFAEESPETWYREAWRKMRREDSALFSEGMMESARKLENERKSSLGSVDFSTLVLAAC